MFPANYIPENKAKRVITVVLSFNDLTRNGLFLGKLVVIGVPNSDSQCTCDKIFPQTLSDQYEYMGGKSF